MRVTEEAIFAHNIESQLALFRSPNSQNQTTDLLYSQQDILRLRDQQPTEAFKMLVPQKHHTVRRKFERCSLPPCTYEVNEGLPCVFDDRSSRNHIVIGLESSPSYIASLFDSAMRDKNEDKTFCVTFHGTSLRHLAILPFADDGTIGSEYSVSPAGEAFCRISHRIRRINIRNPNQDYYSSTGGFLARLVLNENMLRQMNKANNAALEFVMRHCCDTLSELKIFAFDYVDDELIHFAEILCGFQALKTLDISYSSCDRWDIEELLSILKNGMEGLEALDISGNGMSNGGACHVRDMLIKGRLLRLDADHTWMHEYGIRQIVHGCCLSGTLGMVSMKSTRHMTDKTYDLVVEKFRTGELRLFDFRLAPNELTAGQQHTMLQCRARNYNRWVIGRRLQSGEIHATDMYHTVSEIAWDASLFVDAMRTNANDILTLVVKKKGVAEEEVRKTRTYPRRRTRTSLNAWKTALQGKQSLV